MQEDAILHLQGVRTLYASRETEATSSAVIPFTMEFIIRRRTGEAGQGMVEYALILCLVAVIMIAVLISLGGGYRNLYSDIENGLAIATGV